MNSLQANISMLNLYRYMLIELVYTNTTSWIKSGGQNHKSKNLGGMASAPGPPGSATYYEQ